MEKVEDKYTFLQKKPLSLSDGTLLWRIMALRDIPLHNVKAGDIGGYIEDKKILKQEGSAWIGGEAKVYGQSRVLDDCLVTDEAVLHHSLLKEDVIVGGKAKLTDSNLSGQRIRISEEAVLENVGFSGENILITNKAHLSNVFGRSWLRSFKVSGNAVLKHVKSMGIDGSNIQIWGSAQLLNCASVCGKNIYISGEAIIEQNAEIKGNNVTVKDFSRVTNVTLRDNVEVKEYASVIASYDDLYPSISDTVFNGDMEYDISPF